MLPLLKSDRRPRKCLLSSGILPNYIDPAQPPQKHKPFDATWALKWCHTVDVLLPAELRGAIQQAEERQVELGRLKKQNDKFAKVIMKLGEVLEGDFFTEYVKKGDVLMRSEGRKGIDTVFELRDGILYIEVDTPTYERLGLVGRPIRDGGKRHKKNRYVIELNLRLPSMLHGKKGFERLIWACKHVLTQSVIWLFYDVQGTILAEGETAAIEKHKPLWHTIRPTSTEHNNILIPPLDKQTMTAAFLEISQHSFGEETYLSDIEEYLSLLCLGSPRVQASDSIDPFLSRYAAPEHEVSGNKGDIVQIRYRGFVPAAYVVRLFTLMTKALTEAKYQSAWGAMQMHGFGGDAVTVLRTADGESVGNGEAAVAYDAVEENVTEDVEMAEAHGVGEDAVEKDGEAAEKSKRAETRSKPKHGSSFVCWEHSATL